jgi:hypothetical protein
LVTGFIVLLELVTAINYNRITNSHARAKSSVSSLGVATRRLSTVGTFLPRGDCLKTASDSDFLGLVGRLNCCWSSPAQPFLASDLVETFGQDFFPRHVGASSSTRGRVGLSVEVLRLLQRSFTTRLSALSQRSGPYRHCGRFVTAQVTLRSTVNRPVSLGVKPHQGPKTRYLLLSDS